MADKADELYGYGITDEVETGSSRYLAFKKGDKGRVIQLRLVTAPMFVNQHWILGSNGKQSPIKCKGKECPYCGENVPAKEKLPKIAKFGWVVIDRADGLPKLFTGPVSIARQIRALIEDVDWGNPFLYDVKIKRTEEQGAGYYQTVPVPTGKGNGLTDEEKKKVEEAAFNVAEELEGGKKSEHLGAGYGAGEGLETAPESGTPASPTGSEDINPDDIPF